MNDLELNSRHSSLHLCVPQSLTCFICFKLPPLRDHKVSLSSDFHDIHIALVSIDACELFDVLRVARLWLCQISPLVLLWCLRAHVSGVSGLISHIVGICFLVGNKVKRKVNAIVHIVVAQRFADHFGVVVANVPLFSFEC